MSNPYDENPPTQDGAPNPYAPSGQYQPNPYPPAGPPAPYGQQYAHSSTDSRTALRRSTPRAP